MSDIERLEREAKERLGTKVDPEWDSERIYSELWAKAEAALDEALAMVKDAHDGLRRWVPLWSGHPAMDLLSGKPYDMRVELEAAQRELHQARADVKKLRHVLRPPGPFELESDRRAEQAEALAETDREEYR